MIFRLIAIAGLSALALSGCSTPAQVRLDERLSALCAVDGGVTVYETVVLPPSAFNKYGFINFYRPTQGAQTLGDSFIYDLNYATLVPGSEYGEQARLTRTEIQIFRKSDGKILARAVSYNRFGGDFANPGHPTSKSCPERSVENTLLTRLFVRGIE